MAMVNLPAEAVDNPHVGTPLITFYILEGTSFWTGDPRNGHDESTGPSGVIMAGASPMNSSMILWL